MLPLQRRLTLVYSRECCSDTSSPVGSTAVTCFEDKVAALVERSRTCVTARNGVDAFVQLSHESR